MATAHFDRVFMRAEGVVAQQAQDVQVLLQLGTGRYYSLNDVGARVWQLCNGERSLVAVVAVIVEEFDASAEVIAADVAELVGELLDEGLVVAAP